MSDDVTAEERHRRVLGLGSDFGQAELKTAYFDLIQRWHPDRYATQPREQSEATEKAKAINVAYEFLTDILQRAGDVYRAPVQNSRTYPDHTASPTTAQSQSAHGGRAYRSGFTNRTVTEIFLRSSHIVSTGYNRSTQTLYIKFGSNSVYRYFDVPEPVFEAFLKAPSPGRFAHRHIYDKFRNEPCSAWPAKAS